MLKKLKKLTLRTALLGLLLLICGAAGGFIFAKRGIPFVGTTDGWAIDIFHGTSPVRPFRPRGGGGPAITAADVSDAPAEFVADPFMVRHGDTWQLFFEVLRRDTEQGDIALASSRDAKTWKYQQIVLDEPFHLSYPYVFEHDGAWYMIPETNELRSIRLYRAKAFPKQWTLVAELIKGAPFVDASVVQHEERWWLFTSIVGDDVLMLYHAEALTGPWIKHPSSPLVLGDANIARPAGRVIEHEGKVIRYAQDDYPVYGTLVRAFEVIELTPTTYKERPAAQNPILEPDGDGFNALGMHHIDPHRLADGKWIACVDGYAKVRAYGLRY
jgi:hypothetical protein